jgi:hypothetical protein
MRRGYVPEICGREKIIRRGGKVGRVRGIIKQSMGKDKDK